MLSVGGGGKGSEPFAGVARDPASRERFAQTSLGLVQQFGIDGIDSKLLQHAGLVSITHKSISRLGASFGFETG